jgi:hypothetical protein
MMSSSVDRTSTPRSSSTSRAIASSTCRRTGCISVIAEAPGLDRKTARRFAHAVTVEEVFTVHAARSRGTLRPCLGYLHRRWHEGRTDDASCMRRSGSSAIGAPSGPCGAGYNPCGRRDRRRGGCPTHPPSAWSPGGSPAGPTFLAATKTLRLKRFLAQSGTPIRVRRGARVRRNDARPPRTRTPRLDRPHRSRGLSATTRLRREPPPRPRCRCRRAVVALEQRSGRRRRDTQQVPQAAHVREGRLRPPSTSGSSTPTERLSPRVTGSLRCDAALYPLTAFIHSVPPGGYPSRQSLCARRDCG